MVNTETPVCEFGTQAHPFSLEGIDGKSWTLDECKGPRGLLIMFICNHCPFVKAIQEKLVRDTNGLIEYGINSVAIMPNDPSSYPEDSFENMQATSKKYGYTFPYLIDKSQEVARTYGAVCTPDFFGYNSDLELQYRGRLDAARRDPAMMDCRRDLYEAMVDIARTGRGPRSQIPSMGCSIKWRNV